MTVEVFCLRESLVVVGGVCHKTNKQKERKLIECYDITVFRNTVTLLQVSFKRLTHTSTSHVLTEREPASYRIYHTRVHATVCTRASLND